MKWSSVLLLTLASLTGFDGVGGQRLAVAKEAPPGYTLCFSQEFDRDGPVDECVWNIEEGPAQYNEERQYYSAENVWMKDGCLVIQARHEPRGGMQYTSARLNTEDKFSFCYGRVEARIALPTGRGTWSAFWMLPQDVRYGGYLKSGEIDIMEHVGYDHEMVYSTLHTERYHSLKGNAITGQARLMGEPGQFHEYVMEWEPEGIAFYVDGELSRRYTPRSVQDKDEWPFDLPFYFVVNLAIGGRWGAQEGIDDACFPQEMRVDYIRVYQKAD